uniref:DUF4378 domain-containing protein n=1 Tax=Davidia involucrata TaxID=16924 RepID=A0A5B7BJB2_DAVIN
MAASTSKPGDVKQLVEFLKDQQEPFTLDVYLSERKYMKKNDLNSETRNGSNLHSSAKSLTRTCSSNMTLRLVANMLINGYKHRLKTAKKRRHNAETNKLSSSKCDFCTKGNVKENHPSEQNHSSPSQSSFQALKLHNLREFKAASYTKLQLGCIEDSKQLSPVSVLELPAEECSPIDKNMSSILSRKATEDSIFSACLSELLVQSLNEKKNGVGVAELQDIRSGSNSLLLKTKRVFMQTKQLVFDCVKEATDSHGRSEKSIKEALGPEEIGKLICEQIYSWGKHCGDVTNINQLINLDFCNTMEEWRDFSQITRDIGIDIGDAILDDIVTEIMYS